MYSPNLIVRNNFNVSNTTYRLVLDKFCQHENGSIPVYLACCSLCRKASLSVTRRILPYFHLRSIHPITCQQAWTSVHRVHLTLRIFVVINTRLTWVHVSHLGSLSWLAPLRTVAADPALRQVPVLVSPEDSDQLDDRLFSRAPSPFVLRLSHITSSQATDALIAITS